MISPEKREANRNNARKSTGPKSPEGKARSARNAVTHGLTAQPGDTIKFMVSTSARRFHADIVRMIHGDANPKGPGVKETVVETPANTDYPGKHQVLPLGSYVTVPDNPALRLTGSFTLTAWIAPTRHDPLAPGGRAPDGVAPIRRDQAGPGIPGTGDEPDPDGHAGAAR